MTEEANTSHIQDFVFSRELAEIYLLLDNVSTSSDKSLRDPKHTPCPEPTGHEDWISRICQISFPPDGTRVEQAEQAATLFRARDYLNSLAAPANGSTIAFTLLVSGEDNARPDEASGAVNSRVLGAPSRSSLARRAFPGLVSRAAAFRRWINVLIGGLFFWLIFTSFLSWNVAVGNSTLVQLNTAYTGLPDIQKQRSDAEAGARPGTDAEAGATPGPAARAAKAKPVTRYCDRARLLKPALSVAPPAGAPVPLFDDVTELRLCERLKQSLTDYDSAKVNIEDWLVTWRWIKQSSRLVFRSAPRPSAVDPLDVDQQWAAILAGILAGTVLPVAYGILGAGAAVVRGVSAKVRESLLSPRDLQLSFVQLALGAVIGGCIGLFVTPAGSAGQATGLFGTVNLSASALSFIGGFGVEGVFVALERLIVRIFDIKAPAKSVT